MTTTATKIPEGKAIECDLDWVAPQTCEHVAVVDLGYHTSRIPWFMGNSVRFLCGHHVRGLKAARVLREEKS
ncbi:MAG: hypothetical protein ACRBK7_14475 [Acidimicrobiales bacterium]